MDFVFSKVTCERRVIFTKCKPRQSCFLGNFQNILEQLLEYLRTVVSQVISLTPLTH